MVWRGCALQGAPSPSGGTTTPPHVLIDHLSKGGKMSEKKSKNNRYRNFTTVLYPDSAPSDWQDRCKELCVPILISPIHDQDNSEDGNPKKAHYHVIFMFEGVKTIDQIKDIFDYIGGIYPADPEHFKRVCIINSIRSKARYLCHMDDPNKAQYSASDVICLGGADYLSICSLSSDKYTAIQEMMSFCKENEIISLTELLEYSSIYRFDWFRCLCDNSAIIMREYLKSLTWFNKVYEEK